MNVTKVDSSRIIVTVQYVGRDDFQSHFAPQADLQAVKVQAMKHFELDPGASEQYVLQSGTADLSDHGKVGDLGSVEVTLTLTLKSDVDKG